MWTEDKVYASYLVELIYNLCLIVWFFLIGKILLTNKSVQEALKARVGKKKKGGNRLPYKHRLEQKPLKNHP